MLLAVSAPARQEAPMYWRREFKGKPEEVRFVRAFAAHLLAGFPALDDVLLVLDELAVNAIRHVRHEVAHFEWLRRLEVGMVT